MLCSVHGAVCTARAVELTLNGPDLAVRTATRRLQKLLDAIDHHGASPAPGQRTTVLRHGRGGDGIHADISWYGSSGSAAAWPGSEAGVQAMSGLMHVHGRDSGMPRRLGIEVASVTAGVLASQAVLACLVGRQRERRLTHVETSVLEGALQLVSHYLAAATCPDSSEWRPPAPAPAPGPPFRSADGHWFEIETLDPDAWRRFWFELGAVNLDLSTSWTSFRSRYFRGRCSLPPQVHEATALRRLDEIMAVARGCRVSLVPVRSYAAVMADSSVTCELACIEAGERVARAGSPAPAIPGRDAMPLAGIEVVEATSRIQGPLAGLLLQMLGAHVVRVEPPGGDPIRLVPPYAGSEGYFVAAFNRGKEVRELNLATAGGRSDLFDLLSTADLFLHNWGPGRADAWGLTSADVARVAPRATYVECSGWGDAERNRRLIGTEFLVQAQSGLAEGLSPEGEPPSTTRLLLVDCLGALVACEGALAGLWRAAHTGRGAHVSASLMAGAMTLQTHVIDAIRSGREVSRAHGRPRWSRLDMPVRTADGFVALEVQDTEVAALACALGVAIDASGAIGDRIAAALRERASAGLEETLTAEGIACAAVTEDLAAMPCDPRLAGLLDPLADGCCVAATPWRFAA